jgi:hypothetical protein
MQVRKAQRVTGRAKGRFLALATAFLLAFSMILMGGFHAHVPQAEAGIHMSAMQDGEVPSCDKAGTTTQADEACCIAAAGCGLFAAKETGALSVSLLESVRDIAPTTFLHSAMLFPDYPPPRLVLS